MSKILFKNPLILTMRDGNTLLNMDVLIEDKYISKIEKNIQADENTTVIDASNTVLMPGFINAHTHSAMVFSRSSTDNLKLDEWLNKAIFPIEDNFQKDDVYHLTKVAILEYLTSGITTCFDMYYNVEEIAKACLDLNYKMSIIKAPPESRANINEIENTYNYLNSLDKDYIRCNFGEHAEYTSSEEGLKFVSMLCNKHSTFFSTHACETEKETKGCILRHQMTPIKYFDSLSLFNNGGCIFHGIYLNDEDINILKNKNVSVVTCPGSNGKLASGIAPIKTLLEKGVNVAIGTDGAGSNNCLDMFKEMHLLYSFSKIRENDASSLNAYEILKMATVNGAKALGLEKLDGIKVGNYADIILIDLTNPNMQPINNIVSNIVYSGSKLNIKLTMVNGKILYKDYKFYINENIKDIFSKAQEINDRLNKFNPYKN